MSGPTSSVAEDSLHQELMTRVKADVDLPDADRLGVTRADLLDVLSGRPTAAQPVASWIGTRFRRPALPVSGETIAQAEARFWQRRLSIAGRELTAAVRASGRIELSGHPGLRWAGTCWLVAAHVAVTTRDVAGAFTHRDGTATKLGLPGGIAVTAAVRFEGAARAVDRVLIADAGAFGGELAFLVLASGLDDREAVRLSVAPAAPGTFVAAVGHLAVDSRRGHALADLVYAASFNRKCVMPGRLHPSAGALLSHDCATVGNSAAALLLDLARGQAVGLHVAGALESPGLAIPSAAVLDAMAALGLQPAPRTAPDVEEDFYERRRPTAEDYADREGYVSSFVGIDVPPPTAGAAIRADVVALKDPEGNDTTLLRYGHFSVCMSQSRKMCLFTACNVSGGELQDLGRSGIPWRFDPRIDEDLQAGNDLYADNDLDRGHMVRRLDPVWGGNAEVANIDTFHFTNSCPQHKDLNQKTWNDLEDYVLDNAGKHQLKINVFTGPVFGADDPEYRGFRVPLEFWKVVVMVKDSGQLSATAYKLSQVDLVTGLEFVFGEFRTYQVRLRDVEEWTSLDFGDLRNFDPKDFLEAAAAPTLITGPQDLVL